MTRRLMTAEQANILLALNGETRFTSFFQELRLTTNFLRKQGFIQKNPGKNQGFKITFPPNFDYYQWRQRYEQMIKDKQTGQSNRSPWKTSNALIFNSPGQLYTSDYRTNN